MSRHSFTAGIYLGDDFLLTDRERYGYRTFSDNRIHVVQEGETLWALAGRYFAPLPRACGFWWVIADFQPAPIHDPTLKLTPGRPLIVPSLRTLTEEILNKRRSAEAIL
jgi:hypothetical protein